jgi:NitT/TauT family transport system substrate-binding protein
MRYHAYPAERGKATVRIFAVAALAAVLISLPGPLHAQLLIGGTPNAEQATAMVAEQEGIFKKHGIDGQFRIIPINPTIPPALMSGSIQVGVPTPTTFLQAVDNGIDLVIVAGGSVNNPKGSGVGIVVRKGSGIKSAKDLQGKRFGAPGLNAVLHVMVRRWLMQEGVDPKSVNFVESMFPVHADLLKAGQIDAVVTADPFLTRIRQGGDGEEILNLVTTLPDDVPPVMYVTTRDWARKNPDKIKAFRAAIEESASFIAANPDKARDAIGKALKLPPQVLITMNLPKISTKVTPEQMAFWIDVMNKQNMLKTKIDPAELILP